jgi:hypothetical protein
MGSSSLKQAVGNSKPSCSYRCLLTAEPHVCNARNAGPRLTEQVNSFSISFCPPPARSASAIASGPSVEAVNCLATSRKLRECRQRLDRTNANLACLTCARPPPASACIVTTTGAACTTLSCCIEDSCMQYYRFRCCACKETSVCQGEVCGASARHATSRFRGTVARAEVANNHGPLRDTIARFAFDSKDLDFDNCFISSYNVPTNVLHPVSQLQTSTLPHI